MPAINRSALLPYTQRQLFDLVNDIEAYPQYMEGCVGAQVLRQDGVTMEARLDLSRGGIAQSFTTRNQLLAPESIVLELKDGPFERFAGRWHFQALGDAACKVSLELDFVVRSSLLGAAAGRLFERVTNNLVDAVVRRAGQLYG
ncbi:type II toxin-antitoxin system RatA family toxin [Pseudohaliea rubra]|uniref:Putative oligoketide cyclase/dehydratase or lipid transport protein YfjG n=1 Tax=Pseudohaliea rubra DSM 19751 TaxID=1265313 RepID=A0A095VUN5_9GAMM|nr:type II toxin-antitoxin system RatA family toxin [Pseudohaliea rubra]KGE04788.1 putative oligoketide cyclase/dehydratase or lipid transport protein YfjG [Pseudohaliea rubra DSM 19751]